MREYFPCDHGSENYGGLKIVILANLAQFTRDLFHAFDTSAEN